MWQLTTSLWQLMTLGSTDYMMFHLMIGSIGVLRSGPLNASTAKYAPGHQQTNLDCVVISNHIAEIVSNYKRRRYWLWASRYFHKLMQSYIISITSPTVLTLVKHSIRVYIQFSHVMGISVSFLWKQFLLNKLKYRIGHYIIPWPWLEPRGLYYPSKWPPPVSARKK